MKTPLAILPVLALLLAPPAARAQEATPLKWKFNKGDRFALTSESTVRTTTSAKGEGVDKKDEENSERRAVLEAEVLEARPDGSATLALGFRELGVQQKSTERTIEAKASRDAAGKPVVKVEMKGGGAHEEDLVRLLEKVYGNFLEMRIRLDVGPTGALKDVRTEGSPFKDLPEDTEALKVAGKFVRKLISADDLVSVMTTELFTRVPEAPVKAGEDWPVTRDYKVMGIRMKGEGKGRLKSVEKGDGGAVALLSENLTYTVEVKEFCKNLEAMMGDAFEAAGVEFEVEVDIKAKDKVVVASESRFSLDRGSPIAAEWPGMKIVLAGTMKIAVGERRAEMSMEVIVDTRSKVAWKREGTATPGK